MLKKKLMGLSLATLMGVSGFIGAVSSEGLLIANAATKPTVKTASKAKVEKAKTETNKKTNSKKKATTKKSSTKKKATTKKTNAKNKAKSNKSTKNNFTSKASVIKIQNKLNSLGFKCGTADGIMGSKTKSAIKAFQKHNKLKTDGIVGSLTFKSLFK